MDSDEKKGSDEKPGPNKIIDPPPDDNNGSKENKIDPGEKILNNVVDEPLRRSVFVPDDPPLGEESPPL